MYCILFSQHLLGWISSVKHQGSCGSCVAFATAGLAEATLIKVGAAKSGLDLAEQWLVDCKPAGANGCNGASVILCQVDA